MHDSDSEYDDDNVSMSKWKSRPDCWSDDVRMNALFSQFRKRDLNPLHYDSKLNFWKKAILSFCKDNEIIQLDLSLMENSFKRRNIKPKCLDLVLNVMIKEGSLRTLDDALKPKPSTLQTIFNKVVWSPLAWSTSFVLRQTPLSFLVSSPTKCIESESFSAYASPNASFRSTSSPRSLESSFSGARDDFHYGQVLVNINLLETKSRNLLDLLNKNVVYRNIDCVLSYDELKNVANEILTTNLEHDLELIVKYLEVNKKILVYFDPKISSKKFVKFTLNINQNVTPVTDMESSYANLKESERLIEEESNKLNAQIDTMNNEIRQLMKQNNKNQALKLLKKRKLLENRLEKNESTLTNLQTLMTSFQQVDTNKMAYDVYTQSAAALKEANKAVNIDKLDDTIADLQDMINVNNEVEEVLKSPISKLNVDEQELNDELNELLKAEKEKETQSEKLKELDKNYATSQADAKLEKKLNFDQSLNMKDLLDSLPSVSPKKKSLNITSD